MMPSTDADTRAQLQAAGLVPMTVDEVLSGTTQAGVAPPPSFLPSVEDDGTVMRVGATPPPPAAIESDSAVADLAATVRDARAAELAAQDALSVAEAALRDAQKQRLDAETAFRAAVDREFLV